MRVNSEFNPTSFRSQTPHHMELPLCPFRSFLRCCLPPPWQDAHWVVFYALISCWQVLSCPSRDLRSPRMFLQDPDGRCPLSNKQAGSSQMRPRWWHYLSTWMEPGEGCWVRVGASLGQPCVWRRVWPGLEGWCYIGSELLACSSASDVRLRGDSALGGCG